MKITKTSLKTLIAPDKNYKIYWDSELPSFGVRVTAAGSSSYVLQRRVRGKSQRVTICKTNEMSPDAARNEARKLIGDIVRGLDPVAEKKKISLQNKTVQEGLDDYLNAKNLKPRTKSDMSAVLNRYLADWLRKPLISITADMVVKKHKEVGKKSRAQANLAMKYLRAIFSHAMIQYTDSEGHSILTVNPVTRLSDTKRWYRIERRQTVIKPGQLKPWFDAVLNQPENTRAFLLTVLLTGLRSGEAKTLRVDQVDLEHRLLTVLDTKNGRSHTLPLSDYLHEILENRIKKTKGKYVFSSRHGKGHISVLDNALRIVAQESGVKFCLHDLRRTFATIAESLDISAYALKRLLNHSMPDVTAGYIVTDVERLRKPMQKITDFILKTAEIKESAQVVDIKKPL